MVRKSDVGPLRQVFAVHVEDLNALVQAIGHIDMLVAIDGDTVDRVELPVTAAVRAPGHEIASVAIELDDPRIGQPVGDQHAAVRQEVQVLRPAEVRIVFGLPRLPRRASEATACRHSKTRR